MAKQRGIKERIQADHDALKEQIKSNEEQALLYKEAHLSLLSFISYRRDASIKSIENIGTNALKAVCDEDYKIHFIRHEEKKNSSAFKMDICVETKINGQSLITGTKEHRGGGITETCSFGLRIGALEWLNYEGPLLLDEAYSTVSNDFKLENVAQLIKKYIESSGRQIIFSTHDVPVFEPYADQIIKVKLINGVSTIVDKI